MVDSSARIIGQRKCPILLPECFFFPVDADMKKEWETFDSLGAVMGENGDPAPGIVTTHDQFAISFTEAEQTEKVELLINSQNEKSARDRFKLCTQNQWNYDSAKQTLSKIDWKAQLTPVGYRPFDRRWTVFNSKVAVHLRERVMRHMRGQSNIGMISTRQRSQATGEWTNVFVADDVIESTTISNKTKEINYLFPLWLKPSIGEPYRRPNINRRWARDFGKMIGLTYEDGIPRAQKLRVGPASQRPNGQRDELIDTSWVGRGDLEMNFGPRDLFDYIYAVLHSSGYRSRYAEFLKSDFPHIPKPKDCTTFADLVSLGGDLVALHLLSPNEAKILKKTEVRFAGCGETRVEKGFPKYKNGKVFINDTRWFEDVPQATWEFHVGSYQVCQKWLKDRAGKGGKFAHPGRVLSDEDILHYLCVVIALTETFHLIAKVDQVIEKCGDWPDAFKSKS